MRPQDVVGPWCDADAMVDFSAEPIAFEAQLWKWDARRADSWAFVSVPAEASEEIRDLTGPLRRGFGSVRVRATIGGSTWDTSIFPDSKLDCYVLPVKRAIRQAEDLEVGDTTPVRIELVDVGTDTGA
jgi:hypothetical protein